MKCFRNICYFLAEDDETHGDTESHAYVLSQSKVHAGGHLTDAQTNASTVKQN